ncbi:MAG: AAA family ATPase [Spirochaetes bacterium RBG_13_68_11]|nr:MAG: AAA family ATPase [Spirochaetes bacterium RBG_13_68_11]
MVFVGGPRQVGKTTFALGFLRGGSESHPGYLSWDDVMTRGALLRGELPPNQRLLVLDEIHKYAGWRNLLKGFYDTRKTLTSFLVTGSARLDYYRRGGDSLQGRYHHYRLHPFSLGEMGSAPTAEDLAQLLRFGGFPEPLLKGDERAWRRWQRERVALVIGEDLRNLEHVREVSLLELLAEELPNRVGAPLSVRGLALQLHASHEAVERWISIFERLYLCFRIPPFGAPRIRAVRKEQKLYLWDWSMIPGDGERFENLVASQLLKYCHFLEDTEGYRMELRFLRDTDRREVDFVVLRDRRPVFAVECKTGERRASDAAAYFRARTTIPRFYQVHLGRKDYEDAEIGVRVLPFRTFCAELDMP